MCHHYLAASHLPENFVDEFSLPTNLASVFSSAVTDAYPMKLVGGLRVDDTGDLEAFVAEWGLLPRWWNPSDKSPKRAKFQRQTFNARCETAHEKPTFRDAMKKRRCLLPVDEFLEKDHYFGIGEPMSFAGLYETWHGEDEPLTTCTLLTTEPNAEVQAVGHHRMPVLLTTPRERWLWLTEGASEGMLRPLGDGGLGVRPAKSLA